MQAGSQFSKTGIVSLFFAGTRNEDRASTPKTCVENRGTLTDANGAASCNTSRKRSEAKLQKKGARDRTLRARCGASVTEPEKVT